MSSLGSLVVSLAMDTAKFIGAVSKSQQSMLRLGAQAGKMGAAIGAAMSAAASTTYVLVQAAINAADANTKAAQAAGVSVETYTQLGYAAGLAGGNMQSMGDALKKLAKNAVDANAGTGDAKDAFKALNIEVSNGSGGLKSQEQLLEEIADKFAMYRDGAEKTALAQRIFGKAGADMIPLLNQGAAGLRAAREEADALGITMDTRTGQAAERFNDNLTRLYSIGGGLANRVARELLPSLEKMSIKLVNSAKNSSLLDQAARSAATGVRLLASLGVIIGAVFKSAGERLGALAAAVAFVAQGEFKLAWNTIKLGATDTVDVFRDTVSTVKTIWERGAAGIASAAPDLADKLAAPVIKGADKAAAAAKKIKDDIDKVYESIEQRLASMSFDVDTQGVSDRVRGLIELTRQGATGDQLQRYLDLSAAQERYAEKVEAAAEAQRRQNDMQAEAQRLYDDTRTPVERLANEQARLNLLLREGVIDWDTYARATFDAQDAYDKALDSAKEKMADTRNMAKDLGMTFSSAFEDAIVSGRKLGDLLRGLEQDILRIVTRNLVTEPLAGGIEKLFSGSGGAAGIFQTIAASVSSLFGGPFADGGYLPPGRWGIAGERGPEPIFGGRTGMTVQPASSGGIVINQYFAAGTDRRTIQQAAAETGAAAQRALARNR